MPAAATAAAAGAVIQAFTPHVTSKLLAKEGSVGSQGGAWGFLEAPMWKRCHRAEIRIADIQFARPERHLLSPCRCELICWNAWLAPLSDGGRRWVTGGLAITKGICTSGQSQLCATLTEPMSIMVSPPCLVCGSTYNCQTSVLGPVHNIAYIVLMLDVKTNSTQPNERSENPLPKGREYVISYHRMNRKACTVGSARDDQGLQGGRLL
ncbi:hypothetical protein EGW08_003463 [Elysia chlorotica]|uniref:Uncharacterized protein n=1 Tax=Elysia chlorotica TaxID=188477 RepID=A0A3S0ZXX7_ELYCH|nr:hypothetical protein EGW08_003463 [Elysia chlorotica]